MRISASYEYDPVDPWVDIADWCTQHAPKTRAAITALAPLDRRHRAQRATGGWPWPVDVDAFYEWCDGTVRTPEGYLLAGLRPLSVDEVVESWRINMTTLLPEWPAAVDDVTEPERELFFAQLAADVGTAAAADSPNHAPAGTTAVTFVPAFLPIAEDQSGSYLMVDRRNKRRYGCVVLFDKVDGDIDEPRWDSLFSLAGETARSLRSGSPVAGTRLRPWAVGGRLTWSRR